MKSITTIGRLTVLFHRYYGAERDVLVLDNEQKKTVFYH